MTQKWIPIEFIGHSKNDDFKIVSKIGMFHDYSFVPYSDKYNEEDFKSVFETAYDELATEYIYDVGDNVNIELAVTLGLGVIDYENKLYLYNSFFDEEDYYEKIYNDMHLRLGVYYQIQNPNFKDTKLEILFKTKGAIEYFMSIMLIQDKRVINTLFNIFESQKGISNVVEFPKNNA